MTVSRPVPSMGWTTRSVAGSVLLVMEEHRKQVGQRIRQLREAAALSQEGLAFKTGVTVKTISRWENGRHGGYMQNIDKLARALGVEPADIMGEPPAPLGLSAGEVRDQQLASLDAKLDLVLENQRDAIMLLLAALPEDSELQARVRAALERAVRPPAEGSSGHERESGAS